MKNNLMKRKILSGVLVLFIAAGFTACEGLSDCEICKLVIRNSDGDIIESGVQGEYCGTALIFFKAANPPVTDPVTGNVTALECY
jgi:hypothetical protein